MKAAFTVFEDAAGYWIAPHVKEADARSAPMEYRGELHDTKISACREALTLALSIGASEIHLHGVGATTTIKALAKAAGITPFVYWPAASTRIAPFDRIKRAKK